MSVSWNNDIVSTPLRFGYNDHLLTNSVIMATPWDHLDYLSILASATKRLKLSMFTDGHSVHRFSEEGLKNNPFYASSTSRRHVLNRKTDLAHVNTVPTAHWQTDAVNISRLTRQEPEPYQNGNYLGPFSNSMISLSSPS